MDNYLAVGQHILQKGSLKEDRTGVGTRSVRKVCVTYDLREGFPLMTTKKMSFKSIITELLWFLQGRDDNEWLTERGCNIWTPWVTQEDKIKSVYLEGWEVVMWVKQERPDLYRELVDFPDLYREFVDLGYHSSNNLTTSGKTTQWLNDKGIPLTRDKVAVLKGTLNAPYGPTWRKWKSGKTGRVVDQIQLMVDTLRTNPDSRRMVVSSWDSGALPDESISPQENIKNGEYCLAPCHMMHEMYTEVMTQDERFAWLESNDRTGYQQIATLPEDKWQDALDQHRVPSRWLDMCVVIRSNDWILGAPYNIASYAALQHLYAKTTNMVPRILDISSINAHIYTNTIPMFVQQYSRTPYKLPKLKLVFTRDKMEDYVWEDFILTDYEYHPAIKTPVAV